MREPEELFLLALVVAVVLAVILLEFSHGQPVEADEEADQPATVAGLKQSARYRATWARVRDYIDGWKDIQ
jgi:hypothetical protein